MREVFQQELREVQDGLVEIAALGHGQAGARGAIAGLEIGDRPELGPELHRLAAGERTRTDALVDPVLDASLARIDVLPGAALDEAVIRRRGRSGDGGHGGRGNSDAGEHDGEFLHGNTPRSNWAVPAA